MTELIELIEQDHRDAEALFSRVAVTSDRTIALQLCDELERHADAEEQVVYPAIRTEVPDMQEMVESAVGEHQDARDLIAQIRANEDPLELVGLVIELQEAVTRHVDEEESEVLPKAWTALRADRLKELGAEFAAAKDRWSAREGVTVGPKR